MTEKPRILGGPQDEELPRENPAPSETAAEETRSSVAGGRWLTFQGGRDARGWQGGGQWKCSGFFQEIPRMVRKLLRGLMRSLDDHQAEGKSLEEDEVWVFENGRLLQSACDQICDELKSYRGPSIVQPSRDGRNYQIPRVYAVAVCYLKAVDFEFDERTLTNYLDGVQQADSLRMAELWALPPMLQLVMLERIVAAGETFFQRRSAGETPSDNSKGGEAKKAVQGIHKIGDIEWKQFFESHCSAELILREDPSGVYSRMDYESRQLYREAVEELALQSLFSEEEVARQAILLATRARRRAGDSDSPKATRRADVGYYLIDEGSRALKKRLGYKPHFKQKLSEVILEWPEIYYLVGLELTTVALVFFLLRSLGHIIPLLPGLLLLIPASHGAMGLMNYLTALLVRPRRIPKLDFTEGIPPEYTTLVVVPCLLLNEAEVRRNVEALEVRYLGNRDANLYFALLTDPPDASLPFDERDELVGLCSSLIEQLNRQYAAHQKGGFIHLHRHRAYNPAERTWMGWERKRGKLIDLNNLLLGTFDSFPVKAGDLSALSRVRFVITLDADTRLPRETAHRLVGAIAHPLNRAHVDPRSNTVAEGYGILQPRVGVSVESAHHSRLANIYSGQIGFDAYTRAISDVYQDLYGEGSFTGKGIYDVVAFQKVLGRRFPTNALLSHDLLEGSYARAGLVSDIEVIDDYPSHFSAYCRRLHRWVRGDWQIIRWLFSRVPDFHGRPVPNPLTFLSRWKIFDNLRRSLNDVGLFLLLILGWICLPGGPVYWTLVTLGLLLLPTYSQLAFSFLRLKSVKNRKGFLEERVSDFVTGHLQMFVMLAFLPHQAMVMIDAIVRTLVRLVVTHRNLLEWETAAEAETGNKKTPVETYLALTPWMAVVIGVIVAYIRPDSLLVASPILSLWLLAGFFSKWVSRSLPDQARQISPHEAAFLRKSALLTWRYFREYSNSGMRWLIPDNVQEDPPLVAMRLSPTNLGLLLNARLAAYELGFITAPEYIEDTERTLTSMKEMDRFRGHFYNWYDVETLHPIGRPFVSTVDSGNLAACLWTLKQSCLGMASEPLLPKGLWQGIRDHIALLVDLCQGSSLPPQVVLPIQDLAVRTEPLDHDSSSWMEALQWLEQYFLQIEEAAERGSGITGDERDPLQQVAWWAAQSAERVRGVRKLVETLMPWALPEYASILPFDVHSEPLKLASLPSVTRNIERRLEDYLDGVSTEETKRVAARSLRRRLQVCRGCAEKLSNSLRQISAEADRLVEETDFAFLFDTKKRVFSIGYDVTKGRTEAYSYNLLASEARTAVFIAIAKGDVHQDAWFHLGRLYGRAENHGALLSWSGTMFEYLMPALWMRSAPSTVLDHGMRATVDCQKKFGRQHRLPWGISEAAYGDRDRQGAHQYRAFGVPTLALDPQTRGDLVIAPYASFLALPVEPSATVRNLERMRKMGWVGPFGYYESCDFRSAKKPRLVRTYMAHHQGMALMALCNLLCRSAIQKTFHREPEVVATQTLLDEKTTLSTRVGIELPRRRGNARLETEIGASKTSLADVTPLRNSTMVQERPRAESSTPALEPDTHSHRNQHAS